MERFPPWAALSSECENVTLTQKATDKSENTSSGASWGDEHSGATRVSP